MSVSILAVASISAMSALTVHRMRRARFTPVVLSTAGFFRDEPPSESQRQWVLCAPQWRDRSYLLQMAALLLLLLAAGLEGLTTPRSDGLRVDFCVDVSGSMDTRQDGRRRSEIAVDLLRTTLDTIEATAETPSQPAEVRLATFDQDADLRVPATSNLSALRKLSSIDFEPRLIGTNLAALQRYLNHRSSDEDWSPTHVVVISDQPAPRWAIESHDRPVQWIDLAAAVENHGITRIEPHRAQLTGQLTNVRVHLQAWGTPPQETRLSLRAGEKSEAADVRWDANGYARINLNELNLFRSSSAKTMTLELSGTDAWPHDNRAAVQLPNRSQTLVRWQVAGVTPPGLTGWKLESEPAATTDATSDTASNAPSFVVTDIAGLPSVPERVPVLVVGSPVRRNRSEVLSDAPDNHEWFVCSTGEDQPFLRDVNLDALENERAMRPESVRVLLSALDRRDRSAADLHVELTAFPGNSGFTAGDSRVALARMNAKGKTGRLVWMPLLPSFEPRSEGLHPKLTDAEREAMSANSAWQWVFLNAVSWLMDRHDTPLFELTDRKNPEPNVTATPLRLPLHPGEGNTSHGAKQRATFEPSLRITAEQPGRWWQLPLLLALVVLAVERSLALQTGK